VYRSPRGTSVALDARVGRGGLLVMLPDPVVCFADSTYAQDQRFELDAAAGLLLVDWLSSGRKGAGDRWQFHEYASRLAIRRGGQLIMFDAVSLAAEDGDLSTRMGRFDVVCLVVLLGPQLQAHAARALSRVAALPVNRRADLLIAASPIGDAGCLLRIGGVSMEEVVRVVRDYLSFVPALLGDDPWARKW
jgi:urease accessory protein